MPASQIDFIGSTMVINFCSTQSALLGEMGMKIPSLPLPMFALHIFSQIQREGSFVCKRKIFIIHTSISKCFMARCQNH